MMVYSLEKKNWYFIWLDKTDMAIANLKLNAVVQKNREVAKEKSILC